MQKIHDRVFDREAGFYFKPSDFTYKFAEVNKSELHEWWKDIESDITNTLRHAPEDTVCSGDVYMKLKLDETFRLFIATNQKDEYVGYYIVHLVNSFDTSVCHIWLTYFRETNAFSDSGKMIFNTAKRYNCKKITCASTRPGMEYLLEQFGMYKSYTTYETRL